MSLDGELNDIQRCMFGIEVMCVKLTYRTARGYHLGNEHVQEENEVAQAFTMWPGYLMGKAHRKVRHLVV